MDRPHKSGSYTGEFVDTSRGRINRGIFTSQAIYEDELERVFARSWLFVGHESQIPDPGPHGRGIGNRQP